MAASEDDDGASWVDNDVFHDELDRLFCMGHRRALCHECGYDFRQTNEMIEVDAGLRKARSRVEVLSRQRVDALRALDAIRKQPAARSYDPGLRESTEGWLKETEEELASLVESGRASSEDVEKWTRKAFEDLSVQDMDMRAVHKAWKDENPGAGSTMEWGGPSTQRLYEKVAAKPPSAGLDKADPRLCAWCAKVSAEKLRHCANCKSVYYCDAQCQGAAWKGHKTFCRRLAKDRKIKEKKKNESSTNTKKKYKLPLTWEQLAAYDGAEATGQILELRIVEDQSFTRPVFACKDRTGSIRRIADYTTTKAFASIKVGNVLRWKHPRFHFFLDGSSGARLEDEHLTNINVTPS